MSTQSSLPIKAFFEAFGKGNFQGILDAFHPDVTITAVRNVDRINGQLYGTYKGNDGVKEFLTNLGNAFDTQSFSVENVVGGDGVAFANGKFVHKLKTNGNLYPSDWALYAVIKDNKIFEYHFYEDTATFEEANK